MTGYSPVPICSDHGVEDFDCGVESLDRWLRNEAVRGQASGASQTHVWADPQDGKVVAYFTVAPTRIVPEHLSKKQRGGISGDVPGFLLAKLALCGALRGHEPRLGPDLLVDALRIIVRAADLAGGRFIVVDAGGEAAHRFYEEANFQPIPGSMRLIMKVATARAELTGVG